MKSPEISPELCEKIFAKYCGFAPGQSHLMKTENLCDSPSGADTLAAAIASRHQVENGAQPPKIANALDTCKEQMLVRDNYRPEHFIWDLSFQEDPLGFGFLNQTAKNRLTKHQIELIFTKTSEIFFEYFSTRVSVVSTDLSGLARKQD